jgi:succinate-semialdehyde dehydrogenase/glutarate-semialdehyde dehydrogenase
MLQDSLEGQHMPAISSINPATGETLRTFESHTSEDIEMKIQRAADTFARYRRTSFEERSGLMAGAAEILEAEKDAFGSLMTIEMGKPLRAGIEEAAKCAWVCRYYSEHAKAFLSDEAVTTEKTRSFIRYQPLGPVLAVMPWNFPFWQVFRFAAPALMAGNVGLLKHASNVPQCALAIETIFRRAGFPEGVFQTLLIGADAVARVIGDARVAAVTLTGSEAAGSRVARDAGERLKKTVLELGGSDPFIVMPSANLDDAIRIAIKARNINNGQSCIAAKRFIIHRDIADEFERRFVKGMQELQVGDPSSEATDIGPLATASIRDMLDEQVKRSIAAGARLLTGGNKIVGPGNFYEPTVLTDIPRNSPAYSDELFGPVASLFRVDDIDEAIRIANDIGFGLGSSAWTSVESERVRFIDELEAGLVFINGMVASDPRLPFGGVKRSGYGRELGVHGIREFVNIKTVCVAGETLNAAATE